MANFTGLVVVAGAFLSLTQSISGSIWQSLVIRDTNFRVANFDDERHTQELLVYLCAGATDGVTSRGTKVIIIICNDYDDYNDNKERAERCVRELAVQEYD